MNVSRPVILLAALLAVAGCQQVPVRDGDAPARSTGCSGSAPATAAGAFYRQVVALNPRGLPSQDEMRVLGPLLSSEMQASIERARVRQQAMIAAHPGEKPDFIEGSLFTSLFEGPTAVLSATADDAAPTRVAVALAYTHGDTARWTDHALLRCEGGRWRVDDVRFGGDWDFSSQGSLRQALDAE